MASSEEIDVVRRLAANDPTALEDAYRLYAKRCSAVAYSVLRDAALAEDAVQEGFLALWRHRAGLLIRSAGIGPWLFVVTRNAALSALRADARRLARETRTEGETSPPDPFDAVSAGAQAARVRAALQSLPDEQRAVIERAYYHYLTLTQVAGRAGAPLGTVKRRAQLGLQRLSRVLRPQES